MSMCDEWIARFDVTLQTEWDEYTRLPLKIGCPSWTDISSRVWMYGCSTTEMAIFSVGQPCTIVFPSWSNTSSGSVALRIWVNLSFWIEKKLTMLTSSNSVWWFFSVDRDNMSTKYLCFPLRYATSISYFCVLNSHPLKSFWRFCEGFFSQWLPVLCGQYVSPSVCPKCIREIFQWKKWPAFPFRFGCISAQFQSVLCSCLLLACVVVLMLHQVLLSCNREGYFRIVVDEYWGFGNNMFHHDKCGILRLRPRPCNIFAHQLPYRLHDGKQS